MQQPNHPSRNAQDIVTSSHVSQNRRDMGHPSLAAVRAEAALNSPVRFPAEDGGRTLGEMAQRDLDAALQLLADRAQFITGASGAAIALRREGANDMQCRASAGPIAPELGALLSTEFGLSGESVRTRQLLRCDDAARDMRVNQEACRHLGIASVVVMPVANDEEVLGVFELFSGQANAFGDRDLSAVQRLTEMVETAVRLANASVSLPQQLKDAVLSAEIVGDEKRSVAEPIGEATTKEAVTIEAAKREDVNLEETSGEILDEDILLDAPETRAEPYAIGATDSQSPSTSSGLAASSSSAASTDASPRPSSDEEEIIEVAPVTSAPPQKDAAAKPVAAPTATEAPGSSGGEIVAAKAAVEFEAVPKPLFWSAATNVEAGSEKAGEADQSHVPPVLRGLRKCEACGFPISGGRTLCVDCEEKKWRGQLTKPQAPAPTGAISGAVSRKPEGQAFAAAALSGAGAASAVPVGGAVIPLSAAAEPEQPLSRGAVEEKSASEENPAAMDAETAVPELVLSAALGPSQSWLARNKYIVGVVLAVAAAVTAVILLR